MSEKMTTSEPTTGEIVENLRGMLSQFERIDYAELVGAGSVFCGHRSVWSDPDAYKIELAINRLESQERELSGITEELERFRAFHERYAEQTSKKYVDDICALTARAEQSEAREKAAIADMKLIADNVRETHCDETCCFACKYDCDMSINDSGEFNNECPGFDRDDCFDWRGLPQDGEGNK